MGAGTSQVLFGISGGLSDSQLEEMHARVLEVLSTVGLDVNSEGTLAFLRGKPGYRIEGNRVRIDPQLVDECVRLSRARRDGARHDGARREAGTTAAPADYTLEILSGYPTHFVDWRDSSMKPITEAELVGMSRLVDSLYDAGVRGGAPGVPQDVHPSLRGIRSYRIGAEYCRWGGSAPATNDEDIEWIYRMDEVMGRPFGLGIFVVNPLRIEGTTFDQLLKLRGRKFPVMVGSMPQMGVSAPARVLGAFVIAVAAVWGAYAIVREITGIDEIMAECRIWPSSRRSLDIVYGAPEMVLGDLVLNQLRAFYGWSSPDSDAFHSSALFPDQQAAAQRGAFGMAMALAGNRGFRFGGLLGVDLVFSPEQLVLDVETLSYLRRVAAGFEFSEDAFCMEAIRRVGPSGCFLDDDETLSGFGAEIWDPEIWTAGTLGSWLAGRTRLAGDAARERVDKLIAGQTWRLDGAKARALDELVAGAERALAR